jgi:hypothetical protein
VEKGCMECMYQAVVEIRIRNRNYDFKWNYDEGAIIAQQVALAAVDTFATVAEEFMN